MSKEHEHYEELAEEEYHSHQDEIIEALSKKCDELLLERDVALRKNDQLQTENKQLRKHTHLLEN